MLRFFLFLVVVLPVAAHASLLISPSRLVLDERARSGVITLLNNSETTKTYRISWTQKRQIESGGYVDLTEPVADDHIASSMLRHSPRKVTIKPGKFQKIKLRLKMPRELADGEYRSHMLLKVVDNNAEEEDGEGSNAKGMNMIITPRVSFSIPITVRKGKVDFSTGISKIKMHVDDAGVKSLKVHVTHEGDYGSFGSLFAYMKVGGSSVKQIGELHSVALFREVSGRDVSIFLQEQDIPKGAVIQVLYKGEKEYDGQLLGKAAIRYE